jgi:peptidoglycan/LPS O-acetylase OafA/YrhL
MEEVNKILMLGVAFIIWFMFSNLLASNKSFAFLNRRSGRYGAIDGLRGYLALAVFINHFALTWYWKTTGSWQWPEGYYLPNFGKAGVSVFFMITGYLFISKLIKDAGETDWFGLYVSRFFRIYPLYLFAIVLISLFVFAGSNAQLNVSYSQLVMDYIKWFLFSGFTINDFADTKHVIAGVDWSLKYEWLFYLSLPVVSWLMVRAGKLLWLLAPLLLILFFKPVQITGLSSHFFILFAIGGLAAWLNISFPGLRPILSRRLVSLLAITALALAIFLAKGYGFITIMLLAVFFHSGGSWQ